MYKLNYQQAKELVFASGTVADGYNGKRTQVGFAFHEASGKTLVVHEHGFYTAINELAVDRAESLYLLNNHPSARDIVVQS